MNFITENYNLSRTHKDYYIWYFSVPEVRGESINNPNIDLPPYFINELTYNELDRYFRTRQQVPFIDSQTAKVISELPNYANYVISKSESLGNNLLSKSTRNPRMAKLLYQLDEAPLWEVANSLDYTDPELIKDILINHEEYLYDAAIYHNFTAIDFAISQIPEIVDILMEYNVKGVIKHLIENHGARPTKYVLDRVLHEEDFEFAKYLTEYIDDNEYKFNILINVAISNWDMDEIRHLLRKYPYCGLSHIIDSGRDIFEVFLEERNQDLIKLITIILKRKKYNLIELILNKDSSPEILDVIIKSELITAIRRAIPYYGADVAIKLIERNNYKLLESLYSELPIDEQAIITAIKVGQRIPNNKDYSILTLLARRITSTNVEITNLTINNRRMFNILYRYKFPVDYSTIVSALERGFTDVALRLINDGVNISYNNLARYNSSLANFSKLKIKS